MGKNTNDGHRIGTVKQRSQCLNSKTGQYVKRDSTTGRFVGAKNTPYKGVRKEKKEEEAKK